MKDAVVRKPHEDIKNPEKFRRKQKTKQEVLTLNLKYPGCLRLRGRQKFIKSQRQGIK
jgi:hypothetical protein